MSKIIITIDDAETVAHVCEHLQVLRDQIITEAAKSGLIPESEFIEIDLNELRDNNCYGSHDITIEEDTDHMRSEG